MKKLIILLFLITTIAAQNLKVTSIEKINVDGDFYYPQFGLQESEIYFTKTNYQGIYKLDLNSNQVKILNDDLSSGYEFVIVNGTIYYRAEEIINNRRFFKYVEQNLNSLQKNDLTDFERNITTPKIFGNQLIKVNADNQFENLKTTSAFQKSNSKNVIIANNKLLVNDESGIRELNIFDNGYYLWASLSPDQEKLLFHFSGKGTFVSDLQGNIIKELGNANYPSWSSDGNYIIYMNDEDDGHQVLSSDVILYNYQSDEVQNLTSQFDDLAMFPRLSNQMNKIVFSDMNGGLYIINLISE
ncbi:MAG: hypothetical protein K8F60_06850 [Melioribacteraceae bacterium]|jgi:hypothetical protein|nr:hypothetical protein [Melioribacteraceae bacterium]